MADLHRDVKLLNEIVNDLDEAARAYKQDFFENGPDFFADTVEPDLISCHIIYQARANLATLLATLESVVAQSMDKKIVHVEGKPYEKSKKTDRNAWEKDECLHDVLDTRMFDPHTGELKDETPLDKVLHVYNLPAPRLGALRERGLDPDNYCHKEDRGWTIRYPS